MFLWSRMISLVEMISNFRPTSFCINEFAKCGKKNTFDLSCQSKCENVKNVISVPNYFFHCQGQGLTIQKKMKMRFEFQEKLLSSLSNLGKYLLCNKKTVLSYVKISNYFEIKEWKVIIIQCMHSILKPNIIVFR